MQTMKEIFQEIEASGGMTPSRRLRDIAKRFPDQIAFRDKRYGIWNEVTYGFGSKYSMYLVHSTILV